MCPLPEKVTGFMSAPHSHSTRGGIASEPQALHSVPVTVYLFALSLQPIGTESLCGIFTTPYRIVSTNNNSELGISSNPACPVRHILIKRIGKQYNIFAVDTREVPGWQDFTPDKRPDIIVSS